MNIQAGEILEFVREQWNNIPKQYMILIYLAGTVFAFLNCFMGYRLRKVWGCILGVLVGAGGGAGAGYYFLHDKMMALVCGAAGALVLGLLAWLLYKFGVFVMCAGLVYLLITSRFGNPTMTQHIIGMVAGIFAGTLALGYERQMVIAITSVCGGIGGIHLVMLMTGRSAGAGELVLGLILAAIGAVVQTVPYMKDKDWESRIFSLPSRRKKRGLPVGRKKKVVKKKKVTHVNKGRKSGKDSDTSRSGKQKNRDYDAYDEEDLPSGEEKTGKKQDLDQTQEYTVGRRQYETDRRKGQGSYMAPGIGIDLDDLNRELSHEIQKIVDEEES